MGGGDIYTQGPCAILAQAGVDGWMEIDMNEVAKLRRFARDTPQIKCVQDVCYKSLLSGDILVDFGEDGSDSDDEDGRVKASSSSTAAPAPKPRPNKSEPLHKMTSAQEHARRQRSHMLGKFAVDFYEQEDTIGFAGIVAANNTTYPSIRRTDPKRPGVVNLDRIVRILFRADVYGTYEWQFVERVPYGTGGGIPGERVLPGVRVVGSDLPVGSDQVGILRSKVKRLMNSVYRLYTEKIEQTSIADRERARPTLVTNSDAAANAAALSDPNHMPAGPLALMPDGMATREDYDHMKRVGQSVQDANCGTDASAAAAQSQTRKRLRPGEMTEYAIAEGRMLANSHLPEAPDNLLPIHNSVFEMTCLQYGMHMGMLSAGDTTGTAKLNTQQASAETGRFFREAQSERKRRMELILSDAYIHMYRDTRATKFARRYVRRNAGKAPTPDEIDHHLDSTGGPVVSIPSNIPFEQIVYLIEKGFMRWPAGVDLLSNLMCVSQQAWHTKPQIAIEDIAGIPSPAPAAAALAAPAAPKPPASAASKAGSKPKKQKTK